MTFASAPTFFVINLDRSQDRMRSMDAQFAKLRLSYTRISAIDGDGQSLVGELEKLGATVKPSQRCQLSGREIGCYLSHLKTFDVLEQSGAQSAIILEDDVMLDAKFKEAAQSLSARFRGVPVVIKLESWKKRRLSFVAARIKGFEIVFAPHALTETGAYFITAEAMRVLRTELSSIRDPYDDALYLDRAGIVDVLTLSPSVAQQSSNFVSMIEESRFVVRGAALRPPAVVRELWRPIVQCVHFVRALALTRKRFGWLAMLALRRRAITATSSDWRLVRRPSASDSRQAPHLTRSLLSSPQTLGPDIGFEG